VAAAAIDELWTAASRRALLARLAAGPVSGRRAKLALLGRLAGGAVFVAFGVGKFVNHASELASFQTYGLPAPDAFVYAIGVIELAGGLLLIVGLATRAAALVLAGDMVGAIVVSGIGLGEAVSLTLAPAQLAICLFLLWTGPGSPALDRRFAAPGAGPG
jgi:putative oxidoreductase